MLKLQAIKGGMTFGVEANMSPEFSRDLEKETACAIERACEGIRPSRVAGGGAFCRLAPIVSFVSSSTGK